MIIIGNILLAVAVVLKGVLQLVFWLIIIRAVLSWVNPDPNNPIVRFLYSATDPLFQKARQLVPLRIGMIDFSPMILIFTIMFLQIALVGILQDYGLKMKRTAVMQGQIEPMESLRPAASR